MAWALVSTVAKASSGTSASFDTTGADFIVVSIGTVSGNPQISDNQGNEYRRYTGSTLETALNTACASVYFCLLPTTSASHTVTITGNNPSFEVAAFSGMHVTFPLYAERSGSTTTAATIQAGSLTPPTSDCLVIATMAYRDTTTVSIDGGFTITDQKPYVGAVAAGSALAYLIQTTAAAANPTWSWSNSVVCGATLIVVQSSLTGGAGGGGMRMVGAGGLASA